MASKPTARSQKHLTELIDVDFSVSWRLIKN